MPHRRRLILGAAAVLLTACAHRPQTPDELRTEVRGSMFGKVETAEVDRPLRDVAKALQAKASQCLAVTIKTSDRVHTLYRTFTPTVVVDGNRVELYVQLRDELEVHAVGDQPDHGLYYLVADGTPLDRRGTHLAMYGPRLGAAPLMMKAIAGWASGEVTGCPDLTK